jgi:carbon-monoxide dehydrogenase small subunit
MRIEFNLNGKPCGLDVSPTMRLVDLLRDRLGLTGTKEGCGEGECGACTVIVDGEAVNSCLVLAPQVRGRDVITVEGLAAGGDLDILQQKFLEHTAVECGYCIPGMLMSAKALLLKNPRPTEAEIRTALAGNLCRCAGYAQIVAAIKAAAEAAARA